MRTATSPICAPTRRRCRRPRSTRRATRPEQLYGEEYVHPTARQYTRKVKNAQEAHEAIRPSGDVFQTPGQLHSRDRQRRIPAVRADLAAHGGIPDGRCAGHDACRCASPVRPANTGEQVVFNSSGRTITFPGFLKAYVESLDEQAGGEADDAESRLPNLTQGQRVDATEPHRGWSQHQPARPVHRGVADQVSSRSSASGARRRIRRSSRPSRIAVTSTRRAARWSRRGWRSR